MKVCLTYPHLAHPHQLSRNIQPLSTAMSAAFVPFLILSTPFTSGSNLAHKNINGVAYSSTFRSSFAPSMKVITHHQHLLHPHHHQHNHNHLHHRDHHHSHFIHASATQHTNHHVDFETVSLPRTKVSQILFPLPQDEIAMLGSQVLVKGWVRTVRDQKAFAFMELNDGSSLKGVQVIVDAQQASQAYHQVVSCNTGASVAVIGTLVESPGKGQKYELQAQAIKMYGNTDDSYPLQKKRHSLEFLRTIAHLRPRTNSIAAVARVRSTLAHAVHEFFSSKGFIYLHSPIITASDCEGAGEAFVVTTLDATGKPAADTNPSKESADSKQQDPHQPPPGPYDKDFFGKKAYLTVSGQLNAETYACALSDVYTFGPTFRAENSNTTRHLAEFWMIEPEMAFADLQDDMKNAQEFVQFCVRRLLEQRRPDIEFFDQFVEKDLLNKLNNCIEKDFPRCSYTEAIEILKAAKKKFQNKVNWGVDLATEHERYLAEEHFKSPVFIYNYPAEIKAFYMKANDDGKTVAATDLLVPGIGELIGGSQREDRLEVLEAKMEKLCLKKEDYWWYLDLRRYGSVPHAGYGLGFERLVQFVTGMENIRDVIPFPRYPGHAEF